MATLGNRIAADAVSDMGSNEMREDLRDVIENVDPVDTPLFSLSMNVPATAILHEWLQDALAALSTAAADEGTTHSSLSVTKPTRVDNVCQILRRDYSISDTQEAVQKAGINNHFGYETVKKLKELARNSEATMIRNVRNNVTAVTSVAMDGLSTFIQTNTDLELGTNNPGSLIQADFHTLQQTVFEASGVQPSVALVSPPHKRAVSTWYSSITREMGNLSQALGVTVTEVNTDFGPVRFMIERYTVPTTATADEYYLIAPEHIRKAWLIPTRSEMQARDGDITPGMVMHQFTLEVGHEKTCGRGSAGQAVTYP